MSRHTEAAGGAQAKTGKNRDALDRHAGYQKTMKACESRTKTRYPCTGKHNKWEGPSCGWGDDNVKN